MAAEEEGAEEVEAAAAGAGSSGPHETRYGFHVMGVWEKIERSNAVEPITLGFELG